MQNKYIFSFILWSMNTWKNNFTLGKVLCTCWLSDADRFLSDMSSSSQIYDTLCNAKYSDNSSFLRIINLRDCSQVSNILFHFWVEYFVTYARKTKTTVWQALLSLKNNTFQLNTAEIDVWDGSLRSFNNIHHIQWKICFKYSTNRIEQTTIFMSYNDIFKYDIYNVDT